MGKELAEPAHLFEIALMPNGEPIPKRVDPTMRGLMSRYFLSFVDGFIARMGGVIELCSKDNKHSSSIGQEGKKMIIRVLGVPVMEVTSKKLSTPPIEVGSPGYSHIEMYSGSQKYYVYVTPAGKIGVRKTPPPKVK